jgi:hypothetical protein
MKHRPYVFAMLVAVFCVGMCARRTSEPRRPAPTEPIVSEPPSGVLGSSDAPAEAVPDPEACSVLLAVETDGCAEQGTVRPVRDLVGGQFSAQT